MTFSHVHVPVSRSSPRTPERAQNGTRTGPAGSLRLLPCRMAAFHRRPQIGAPRVCMAVGQPSSQAIWGSPTHSSARPTATIIRSAPGLRRGADVMGRGGDAVPPLPGAAKASVGGFNSDLRPPTDRVPPPPQRPADGETEAAGKFCVGNELPGPQPVGGWPEPYKGRRFTISLLFFFLDSGGLTAAEQHRGDAMGLGSRRPSQTHALPPGSCHTSLGIPQLPAP